MTEVNRKSRVVSISLDDTIATEDGWSRQRQQEYAEHFREYVVVVKTENKNCEVFEEGSLTVIPTNSYNRYTFVVDVYRTVVNLAREKDIDVITVQDPFILGVIGWLLKCRTGASLHTQDHIDFIDNPSWVRGSYKRRVFESIGQWVIQHSDAIRVGTTYEQSKLHQLVESGTPVHCAPVQIDTKALTDESTTGQKKEVKQELNLDERPVVLFAGRFVPQKNLKKFVEVADIVVGNTTIKPIFLMSGDGPIRDEIMGEVEERGLEDCFRFPGFVSETMVSTFYDISDICLLTSDFEGTCRVLVEAGLNEIPVVATPFAGARDNIEHGETGYVESETSALADRVVKLLENDEKRELFGCRSRRHLEGRFDSDRLVREFVEFLQPA